jgi:apolipoprotein N-acyltransferase
MHPSSPPPAFRPRWAALVALGSGIAGAYAFPAAGLWPLILVSVAGLSVAVHGRRSRTGACLGMLYGLGFFVPLLHWTGIYVGAVPWLLLAVAEAVFCAGLGAVLTLVQRLPGAPVWVATTWVLQEFLRDRIPFGGFPWGRLAFSQAGTPLRWFAALGGAPLVSFAVALTAALLALALRFAIRACTSRSLRAVRPLALALAATVAVPAVGALLSWPLGPPAANRTTRVALIQGNVPDVGLQFEARARQVLDNHVAETEKLAAAVRAGTAVRPDLVIWPENSSDVDPCRDHSAFVEISRVVRDIGAPVLVGAILQGPGPKHRRNAGILWSPTTGPGARYIKRHPVPFAEYIPMRSVAEWVSSDAKLVTEDMVAGHGNGLVSGGPFPIGDVICFEVAYDSLVRSSVAAGAQLLVVQTNNATFGHTSETYQQLAMSRLRAVESGRVVLQAATTGASAIIAPDGRVRERSGALFTPDILQARVGLRTAQTPATRVGAIPEYLLAAIAVLAACWSLLPAWRARRSGPTRPAPVPSSQPDAERVSL